MKSGCSLFRLSLVLGLALLTFSARAYKEVDAWPLFELSNKGTTVVYPFYVHEGNFLMVFPFYYRTNEGRDHHIVWPLVKFSEGRLTRVAPFWFSGDEKEYTLFPLISEDEESIFWSVPPIYIRKDGGFKAVFPFWAKGRESWFVFPDVYHMKNADQEETSVFPFFCNETDKDGSSFWLLPYAHKKTKAWESRQVFPLWYSGRNPADEKSSTLWAFPYFQRRRPAEKEDYCFPFVLWDRSSDDPAGAQTEKNQTRFSDLHVLWPLYHKETRTAADGRIEYRHRRFLIFNDYLNSKGEQSFSLFGLGSERH